MRLEPLYTVRFRYPDGWGVALTGANGTEEHDFYLAEGRCGGRLSGKFRAANHPRRRTDESYEMEMQGFIETDDGATVMVEFRGYGRSRSRSDERYAAAGLASEATKSRRQVVGFARHLAEAPRYSWLNDSVCALVGEVRAPAGVPPADIQQGDVQLVFAVSELVWEPLVE